MLVAHVDQHLTTELLEWLCQSPDAAWALFRLFLGNTFLHVQQLSPGRRRSSDSTWVEVDESPSKTQTRIRTCYVLKTRLIGHLYLLIFYTRRHGHKNVAYRMDEILGMITEYDIADWKVRRDIQEAETIFSEQLAA